MAHDFETREEIYNFFYWMKQPKNKKYLDKIPLEIIRLSLRSNGLNPKSVCLYGKHKDCGCNTCVMKIKEFKGLKKGVNYWYERRIVKIDHFSPSKSGCSCEIYIKDIDKNSYFSKWLNSKEVKKLRLVSRSELKKYEKDLSNGK